MGIEECKDEERLCNWRYDKTHDKWDTECREGYYFAHDGPKENNFNYCPYCGRKIKVMEFEPDIDISEDGNKVEIKGRGLRYVVFFDRPEYTVFVGRDGEGSLVEIPDPDYLGDKLEYWPKW